MGTPLNCAPIVCGPNADGTVAVSVAIEPATFAVPTGTPSIENVTVPPFGGGAIVALTLKGLDAAMTGGTTIDVVEAPTKAYASFNVAVPTGVVIETGTMPGACAGAVTVTSVEVNVLTGAGVVPKNPGGETKTWSRCNCTELHGDNVFVSPQVFF